jgi:16S rRNA (guanine527-N7)-methyltransferase
MDGRASAGVRTILERSRELGFLGPGDIERQLDHALGLAAGVVDEFEGQLLDLGSGGGVPGIVLLDRWPACSGVLLDAQRRRCEFLEWAVGELGWTDRVRVECGRAELLAREARLRARFDLVTARSFGRPAVTAECAVGFLRAGGTLLVSEPPEAQETVRWDPVALSSLGLGAPRPFRVHETTGVTMQLSGEPDGRWPRRDGVPAKRPLW